VTAALEGVRVVELGCGLPASYATKLLGLLGADVMKVEPIAGDPERGRGPFPGDDVDRERGGGLFRYLNADKRSVLLDPGVPGDLTTLQSLCSGTDVLVESLGPGGLESLGLAPSCFTISNPHLAVVRISPFGRSRAGAQIPAVGLTMMAAAGWMPGGTAPEARPMQTGGRIHEYTVGVYAACAALTAMRAARSGATHAVADLSTFEVFAAAARGIERGEALPAFGIERCADGWVGFDGLTDQQFAHSCAMLGAPEFAAQREEVAAPGAPRDDVRGAIQAWLDERTVDEIVGLGQAFGLPVAPVADGERLRRCPQLLARGFFACEPGGDVVLPGPPWRLSVTPARVRRAAPTLAQGAETAAAFHAPRRAVAATHRDTAALPFAGLRVVDLTPTGLTARVASYFAAFGAVVERLPPIEEGTAGPARSWALARADIVACDHSAAADEAGLSDAEMIELDPKVVVLRMSRFGTDGPWHAYLGGVSSVERAAGMSYVTGPPERPMDPGGIADVIGVMHAIVAVQGALEHREQTGTGQVVEVAQLEVGCCVSADQVLDFHHNRRSAARRGNRDPRVAPQGVYRGADGGWTALSVRTDADWRNLVEALGQPLWATDGFATVAGRLAGHDDLDGLLAEWFAPRPAADALRRLRDRGVPAAPVVPHGEADGDHAAPFGFRLTPG
jgi:crotonobetainyl-CoA:carnitine CoA-transferase CaiB-like acyl-CoA transferase